MKHVGLVGGAKSYLIDARSLRDYALRITKAVAADARAADVLKPKEID